MSLRAFHIFFILLSTLLAAGCAVWAYANQVGVAIWAISGLVSIGLGAYGVSFVRKSRKLIL